MNTKTCTFWAAAMAVAASASLLSFDGGSLRFVAAAAAQEEDQGPTNTRKTPAMREKVFSKLSEAQELSEADPPDYAGAVRVLNELRQMDDLNSYERAQMWNFFGFVYYSQERYAESIRAYESVLQQPDLPEALETGTVYTLAQLHFTQENYAQAVDYLNRWFRVADNPGPEPYILLAQAYYQMGGAQNFRQGVQAAQRALQIAEAQGKQPKENWYLLLRVFYYELENNQNLKDVLEILVSRWPKKEYWTQLSYVYGELDQERRQLSALDAAYVQGLLDRESEVVQLAQLMMNADAPYRAAKILEKGIEDGIIEENVRNYRLLSQAWQMAQEDEKAIPPLREAAARSSDGELDMRLAQSYLNLDQFQNCVEASRTALRKGDLSRTDTVNILLGMCLYELEQYDPAMNAFQAAAQDSRSRQVARQWVDYIEKEVKRRQELRESLARG